MKANAETLRRNSAVPSPLSGGYVPVDMDVTPFDNSKTKKEGVSRTYKGFDLCGEIAQKGCAGERLVS